MRIALAGLGNVGAATLRLIHAHKALFKKRGLELSVTAISARDKSKSRNCDMSAIEWVDNPCALAMRKDVDLVVELIGGASGVALDLAQACLKNGKHLVTANKAMIAAQGVSLAKLAEKAHLQLSFEASVCGGIPILKTIREALAANRLSSVRGILNGTTNYILTRMGDDGMGFDEALAEAQQHGYAEADPTADIDGHDAANKLAILSALSFGRAPDLDAVFVEGIRHITRADLLDAAARDGRIKLLGISTLTENVVVQRVQPVFVPLTEPLARVGGVMNGIEVSGDCVGKLFVQGAGAGGDATASAIVADIMDISYGYRRFAFGLTADKLK